MVPLAHFTCHGRGGMIGAEKGTPLMTPFMLAVQALLEGDQPPEPATKPSRPRPVAKAADTHVILRSLAEQLVSEANAVLRGRGVWESAWSTTPSGELMFTVRHGDRAARVRTVVSGHTALGQLVKAGAPSRSRASSRRRKELQALVLSLARRLNEEGHDRAVRVATSSHPRKRQTYQNVIDRLGDQPVSRYLEGTLDVQPREHFHYRPPGCRTASCTTSGSRPCG